MPDWGSFSYAFGPVVVFVTFGVILLVMRAAARRSDRRQVSREGRPMTDAEVMAPLRSGLTWADANRLARHVKAVGIHVRIIDVGAAGGYQVVVPADDLAVARTAAARHR